MGFRFRKSIKILPGVRLNLNKKSTSVTLGGKGVKYTVSSTGKETASIGVPGTGISYSESRSISKHNYSGNAPVKSSGGGAILAIFFLLFFIILIFGLSTIGNKSSDEESNSTNAIHADNILATTNASVFDSNKQEQSVKEYGQGQYVTYNNDFLSDYYDVIPNGEYYITIESDVWKEVSSITVDSLDEDDSNVIFEYNLTHYFVTLEDNQFVKLLHTKATPVQDITLSFDCNNLSSGMYRVGIDIPFGEYQVSYNLDSEVYLQSYAIYSDSTIRRNVLSQGNISNLDEQSVTVIVESGQYLYLKGCTASLMN